MTNVKSAIEHRRHIRRRLANIIDVLASPEAENLSEARYAELEREATQLRRELASA